MGVDTGTSSTTPGARRPTGRRAGESGTRDAILDAAQQLFAELGYDGATFRGIAAAADVDPALIRHFFRDKESLFATVVADRSIIPERIAAAVAAAPDDPDGAGRAMAGAYLHLWEDPETGPILMALARSAATSEEAARMLREVLLGRLSEQTAAVRQIAMPRLALAGTHLLGIAVARHILGVPPIAELSVETLVEEVGPTIGRYLAGTHR